MTNGTARPTSLLQPQRPAAAPPPAQAAPMQGQPGPQDMQALMQLLPLLALLLQGQGGGMPPQGLPPQGPPMMPPGMMP